MLRPSQFDDLAQAHLDGRATPEEIQLLEANRRTAEIYRKHNLWPMRLWALVSLAPHSYLMAICAMSDRLELYLYIRVFLMNGVFLVAATWQRFATCRTLEDLGSAGAVVVGGTRQSTAA